MDYENYCNELLECLITAERMENYIQGNVSLLAKGEVAVLMYLMNENDGVSAIELSQYFHINTSRVAAILNGLCKKGYARRIRNCNDKRKIQVFITDKGKEYAMIQKKDVLEHIHKLVDLLGENDAREHLRIMKKIANLYMNFI